MIFEAGYDLYQVIAPCLTETEASKKALWMLAMDKNLRMLFTLQVSDTFEGSLTGHIDDIVAGLECDYGEVHYFVLAHSVSSIDEWDAERVYQDDLLINKDPKFAGREYLGRLVRDEEWVYSSWPRYSFRDYIGKEHLPRAAVLQGPHDYPCDCLACTQHQEYIEERRAARQATTQ
jgi:hypothetical protein